MNVVVQVDRTELVAWPIAPGAMLIAGRSWQPIPAAGIAGLERRRADRGPFRSLSWALDAPDGLADAGGDAGLGFVAAVRLPPATAPTPGQSLHLEDPRGGGITLRLPNTLAGAQDFAAKAVQLSAGQGEAAAALARFLITTFPASAMLRLPSIGVMLAAMLAGLATDDGCIELMGAIPGACGFLQGWGGPVPPEPHATDGGVEALLVGDRIARARVRMATFARPDIVTPACGMVLVVGDHTGADAPIQACLAAFNGLEHVYLLTERAVLRRTLVERRLLNPADSVGHIRDMLPSLSCAPAAADCLRLALRPRYEGRETLSEQPLPVRAAVDQALLLAPEGALPAGIYLGGWLYDPTGVVTEVTIRDPNGFAARLDSGWTRIARADVTQALSGDTMPSASNDAHGFAVYADGIGTPTGPLYLDIGFSDGSCAFLPVAATTAHDADARTRALAGTDLHKSSGIAVIERQLGPLYLALMRRFPTRALNLAPLSPLGIVQTAIIVPLVGAPKLPRAVLSQFLHEPLASDETLVLVCGSQWDDGALAALRRNAGFMGLPAKVLQATEATDAAAALDLAAEAVVAQRYLLLDPATAGCRPGWRRALRAAADASDPQAVICPTLVYEDLSIRYAGAEPMTALPVAPYVAIQRSLAGLPVALADDGPPRAVAWGTLACCLVPRTALASLGCARSPLATAFGQESAFFMRLRSAAIACVWAPRAQVYAPDSAYEAAPTPAATVGRLVDGWCLRAAQETGLFTPKIPAAPTPAVAASKRAEG